MNFPSGNPDRRAALARCAIIVLVAVLPAPTRAVARDDDPPQPDFALVDPADRLRHVADFHGKVLLVTFGYTQCPDVCQTTLALLAQVMRDLGADATRVQAVFITLEPARDTRVGLGRYVTAFDPSFLGLSGSEAATRRAAEAFDVTWEKRPGRTPTTYTIDHTAATYVVDPQGRLRSIIAYGLGPKAFVHDIRRLLGEARGH